MYESTSSVMEQRGREAGSPRTLVLYFVLFSGLLISVFKNTNTTFPEK